MDRIYNMKADSNANRLLSILQSGSRPIFFTVHLLLFTIISLTSSAQDTLYLKEIAVVDNRFSIFNFADSELITDSMFRTQPGYSLRSTLTENSSLRIKSYGSAGNLATSSLRGAPSNHTLVLWNGFPVNSASTGIADLSLYNFTAFNEIKVIPGAASALYGSGSSGGVIELNNLFRYKKNVDITLGIENGSFNHFKQIADIKLKYSKLEYRLSIMNLYAENNFPFIDHYKTDDPLENRLNNTVNGRWIAQFTNLLLNKQTSIETGLLYQLKHIEIPNIAGSYLPGNQNQKDTCLKSFLRINKYFKNSKIAVGSAFFIDDMTYTDKINASDQNFSVFSKMNIKSFYTDASYIYAVKHIEFNISALFSDLSAVSPNYGPDKISEKNFGLFSAFKYRRNSNTFLVNSRLENFKNTRPVFTFSYKKKMQKIPGDMVFNISNSFRRPSLNEKYWAPGGNPDLKNETGFQSDLILKQEISNTDNLIFNTTQSVFYSEIHNMIQWVPVSTLWTPVNRNKVRIMGAEFKLNGIIKFHALQLSTRLIYVFSDSKLIDEDSSSQLIYTPVHSGKLNLEASFNNFFFGINTSLTGKRFTTADNNPLYALPNYSIWNLSSGYTFKYKHFQFPLSLHCTNFFNKNYEDIRAFPAPGRAWYINFNIRFSK
jgi:outer membrane cobalamin receptor